ncbi:peptidoglycan DD-metalloendopeptidase family protein [Sinomonas sp. JGH33]|uniref:Peptidoglycan DD-metalloendopeptidase family protein n=1 Tax=Sinomonas terricola TaxID=3110330 RepID=A0ABU5TBA2_9MICC|nr:peptidoglycan DD-metalloendopeptidase family protein [Sinomonas sp. JGH33]MEA5456807.1 peptidoglycan DD-metalloendopeptidase family protein [Sinomonas sp. JGH33]
MNQKALAALVSASLVALGLAATGPAVIVAVIAQQSASPASCLPGGAAVRGAWGNPVFGPITSPFGPRGSGYHDGTDIAPPAGTPFVSASAGTVIAAYGAGDANPTGDTGNGIIVDAGDGLQFWYWHAQDGSTLVRKGQKVQAGTVLARVGSTGKADGPHLHFQVMVNGAPVDPVPFMAARGVKLGADAPQTGTPADASGQQAKTDSTTASGPDGGSIPFSTAQTRRVADIVDEGRKAGAGDRGILVAVMVALQESGLWIYANSTVPASLQQPHDRVGSDHDSVGLFQQRPAAGWGTAPQLMDSRRSAQAFFGGPGGPNRGTPRGLLDVPGWQQMSLNDAAQAVQGSATPNAYGRWESTARQLLAASGVSFGSNAVVPGGCTPASGFGAGQPLPGADQTGIRAKIVEYAKQGLGTPYVWGGTSKDTGWDCSGFVQWAMTSAGLKGVPRTEQWQYGKPTSSPQPGDLVVQIPDGPSHWAHVGIYAGDGKMYSALNPGVGTVLHPVDWNQGTSYFTLTDS